MTRQTTAIEAEEECQEKDEDKRYRRSKMHRTHLITVLIALKSALPPMLISFRAHVNWTLELTATNFQGASVDVVSTSST